MDALIAIKYWMDIHGSQGMTHTDIGDPDFSSPSGSGHLW